MQSNALIITLCWFQSYKVQTVTGWRERSHVWHVWHLPIPVNS